MSGDEDSGEGNGLPDACIYSDDGWALLVESKVSSPIKLNQLKRHIATAQKHDFEHLSLLLLSIDNPPNKLPANTTHRYWREVYTWFGKHRNASSSARIFTEYMEILESRMIAQEYLTKGTLTMFDGIHFTKENPYSYREAKRLIRLLGNELQACKAMHDIGVDPTGKRRPAITGSQDNRVWDSLPLRIAKGKAFTKYPHYTLSIREHDTIAAATIPNGVKGPFRKNLKEMGQSGFVDMLIDIENRLKNVLNSSPKSRGMAYAMQRHYASQSSPGVVDAHIHADIQTITKSNAKSISSRIKYQPQWVSAIYEVLIHKQSNIQFGIEVVFSYDCPQIQSSKAVKLYTEAFIAMKPLLDKSL